MTDQPTNSELGVRVALLEQSLHEIRDNTSEMARSLQSLTRLEERHVEMSRGIERAFNSIREVREDQLKGDQAIVDRLEAINNRVIELEKEAPLQRVARNLVFTFCGGCTVLVLMYVARLAGLWTGGSLPHP
jgi:hypothetical protein